MRYLHSELNKYLPSRFDCRCDNVYIGGALAGWNDDFGIFCSNMETWREHLELRRLLLRAHKGYKKDNKREQSRLEAQARREATREFRRAVGVKEE